jgi:hypothetical protein
MKIDDILTFQLSPGTITFHGLSIEQYFNAFKYLSKYSKQLGLVEVG